jgi:hypothetical protein
VVCSKSLRKQPLGVPLVLYRLRYPGNKIFNKALSPLRRTASRAISAVMCCAGFGDTQIDFAVQRQFPLTEELRLNFRSEFFNIFNQPNFGAPNNNQTTPCSAF